MLSSLGHAADTNKDHACHSELRVLFQWVQCPLLCPNYGNLLLQLAGSSPNYTVSDTGNLKRFLKCCAHVASVRGQAAVRRRGGHLVPSKEPIRRGGEPIPDLAATQTPKFSCGLDWSTRGSLSLWSKRSWVDPSSLRRWTDRPLLAPTPSVTQWSPPARGGVVPIHLGLVSACCGQRCPDTKVTLRQAQAPSWWPALQLPQGAGRLREAGRSSEVARPRSVQLCF